MGKVTCKMDTDFLLCCKNPIGFLSHTIDRMYALLCDSKLHGWKWILFAYHSCVIVFFFDGFIFASWKALLIFSDLQEIVLPPGNADITPLLHKTALGTVLCVFPKSTVRAQPCILRHPNCDWLTNVLDTQSMPKGTKTKRSVATELSPSLLGF